MTGVGWWLTRPLPPLKGFLDAQMTRPGDKSRQSVRLNDPASRPLRPGDEIRVFAKLNRPAYAYLVWIDAAGEVTPMYPWTDGDWEKRVPEARATEYEMPRLNGKWAWWPMGPGKAGLEQGNRIKIGGLGGTGSRLPPDSSS